MPIEYKSMKAVTMGIEDRTITGIFCVHGNVDDGDGWLYRDRSHPGLFGDFAVDGRKRARFLWAHDSYSPPIATIDDLFEVARADLPTAVRLYAPDATGAVAVKRTYLTDDYANRVFGAVASGALSEMSYSYELKRYDIEETEDGSLPIRNLYEAKIFDVSDVNWGMNPATSADGAKGIGWKARPLATHAGAVEAAIVELVERIAELKARREKAGRVFSAANYTALEGVAAEQERLAKELRDLLAQAEPKQQQQQQTPDRTEARQLLIEFQRTLARANGVAIP
jgi:phage head maturation protease